MDILNQSQKNNSSSKKISLGKLTIAFIFLALITASALYFYPIVNKTQPKNQTNTLTIENKDHKYYAFIDEIYDSIQDKYWNKMDDAALTNLYKLAIEKISAKPQTILINNKSGVNNMIKKIFENKSDEEKKQFTVDLANIVLANLEPFGRAGLYTEQKEKELKNTVQNIDPSTDLFAVLGLDHNAPQKKIKENFNKKSDELNKILSDNTKTEQEKNKAQQQLALVNRAYDTLKNETDKKIYAQTGIETAVDSKLITPNIFYIHIKKISPTSFEEFQRAANSIDNQPKSLNTLILDLRGNIGGSVDLMQWFLGPFIGPGNLAYEFYHQDKYEPFKTKTGWLPSLVRYKKMVVLTDDKAQSSAEVMAAALKKYNVGILVGTKTKGWGTIEKVFPIKNQIDDKIKYSMFLVHSLTLRDDNQPIEGRGVDPHIDITSPDWDKQLLAYFNYPALVKAVKELWNK